MFNDDDLQSGGYSVNISPGRESMYELAVALSKMFRALEGPRVALDRPALAAVRKCMSAVGIGRSAIERFAVAKSGGDDGSGLWTSLLAAPASTPTTTTRQLTPREVAKLHRLRARLAKSEERGPKRKMGEGLFENVLRAQSRPRPRSE